MKHKTINGWTKKEMLSVIETDFNGKSVNNDGHCFYKNEDKKCAVGVFIPSEFYDLRMEGKSATNLTVEFPEVNLLLPLDPIALQDLQSVHDLSSPDQTKEALIKWINLNVKD